MSWAGAVVLYPIIWFLCFFLYLQQRVQTQDEKGKVTHGTPRSAPAHANIKSKAVRTTIATTIVWGIICLVVTYGGLGIQDLDLFNRWGDGQYG